MKLAIKIQLIQFVIYRGEGIYYRKDIFYIINNLVFLSETHFKRPLAFNIEYRNVETADLYPHTSILGNLQILYNDFYMHSGGFALL